MDSEETYEESGGLSLPPYVYGVATLLLNIAAGVAAVGAVYLLYGLFAGLGDFASWDASRKTQMMGNIGLASTAMLIGLAVASIMALVMFWYEEVAGLVILIGAALVGWGIPFAFAAFGGQKEGNRAVAATLQAFPTAALVPMAIGGVLFLREIFTRTVDAARRRAVDSSNMAFGKGAKKDNRPARMSLMGKCWEGPYCRDWIRPQCPIYIKRQACWKNRVGCYCEEDIVSNAAKKVQGVVLEMAAEPQYNFANSANPGINPRQRKNLSPAEKAERCRNCVIYNEHQKEKYQVLMPVVLIATIGVCVLLAPMARDNIGTLMNSVESVVNRFAFQGATGNNIKLSQPNEIAKWALVGAFSLMLISKVLQVVEWLVFVKKV